MTASQSFPALPAGGQNNLAQGNALGQTPIHHRALKGQNKSSTPHKALRLRTRDWGMDVPRVFVVPLQGVGTRAVGYPGRCPGLSCWLMWPIRWGTNPKRKRGKAHPSLTLRVSMVQLLQELQIPTG
jgi:hypothetical protein